MARGKRKHPTESLGVRPRVMSEINTVHAFGAQGQETSGWPYQASGAIGTPIGGGYVYRPPRLSQNELGGRSRKRRRHPTESLGG
jgi:hypothetical protein